MKLKRKIRFLPNLHWEKERIFLLKRIAAMFRFIQ